MISQSSSVGRTEPNLNVAVKKKKKTILHFDCIHPLVGRDAYENVLHVIVSCIKYYFNCIHQLVKACRQQMILC